MGFVCILLGVCGFCLCCARVLWFLFGVCDRLVRQATMWNAHAVVWCTVDRPLWCKDGGSILVHVGVCMHACMCTRRVCVWCEYPATPNRKGSEFSRSYPGLGASSVASLANAFTCLRSEYCAPSVKSCNCTQPCTLVGSA